MKSEIYIFLIILQKNTFDLITICFVAAFILSLLGVTGEKYFHYTTASSGDAIRKSLHIKPSDEGASRGEAVYLTRMSPFDHRASTIADNNWQDLLATFKTKRVFEIEMSSSQVEDAGLYRRDVYIYKNGNLELKDRSWVYYAWPSGLKGKLEVLASGTNTFQMSLGFTMTFAVVSSRFFSLC